MKRSMILLTAMVLSACGGDHGIVAPPPPPPPPAGALHVELKAGDALLFTGSKVPASALVSRVLDDHGNVVTGAHLAVTVPSGWTVSGDTIIAPSAEKRGIIRFAASTGASGSLVSADASIVAADSLAPTDSLTATAGVDLRGFAWRASWSCAGGTFITTENIPIDSATFDHVAVDSVVYPGDESFVPNFGGVAQVWWTGPEVRFLRNGTVDTVTITNHQVVARQAPDSLILSVGSNNPATGIDEWPAVKASESPLTYTGGTWCDVEWRTARGAVTLEAEP